MYGLCQECCSQIADFSLALAAGKLEREPQIPGRSDKGVAVSGGADGPCRDGEYPRVKGGKARR
jgi:hypothetical protein